MRLSQKLAILAGAVCAVITIFISLSGKELVGLDGLLFDRALAVRASLSPPPKLASRVAVVSIDPNSLEIDALKRRPLGLFGPTWAKLITNLVKAEAQAIIFDLIFQYSDDQFRDDNGEQILKDYDNSFRQTLFKNKSNLVLAYSAKTKPAQSYRHLLADDPGALGIINYQPDADAILRNIPTEFNNDNGKKVTTLLGAALERAGVQKDNRPDTVILAPTGHPEEIIPTYKLEKILACAKNDPEALKRVFKGRVIFVGWTGPEVDRKVSSSRFIPPLNKTNSAFSPCGLQRVNASVPTAKNVPGVHLWALAAETVLSKQLTDKADPYLTASVAGIAAIAGTAIGFMLAPLWAFIAIVSVCFGLWALEIGLIGIGLWSPVGLGIISVVVSAVVAYIIRFLLEERKRRRVEKAFGYYLAPSIVNQLVESSGEPKLGGEKREITAMFADLSGFTALSTKLEPEELVSLTNKYLALITHEVEAAGGYVDKFIGDAVMAVWGAPVVTEAHAEQAVSAAVRISAQIDEENRIAKEKGEIGFRVKIGVNSGEAIVGNVGSEKRFNYTAIGEAVNIASRLENLPGAYDCTIVIGDATAAKLGDQFILREIDCVTVKGIEEALPIFEPINETFCEIADSYAVALGKYRNRDFEGAISVWQKLDDGPSKVMAARAKEFLANPPSINWTGEWPTPSGTEGSLKSIIEP
jgi:adenylate cyclase